MQDRDNPCWPCTWGTIRGIEDVNSGSALELLPSLTAVDANALADEDDPASEFEDVDTDADLSLGLRYAPDAFTDATVAARSWYGTTLLELRAGRRVGGGWQVGGLVSSQPTLSLFAKRRL